VSTTDPAIDQVLVGVGGTVGVVGAVGVAGEDDPPPQEATNTHERINV